MLKLEEVSKSYGGVRAAGPLSMETEPGRTSVLIGRSGCGKSTLLRLMIGLVPPDSGEVILGGERLVPSNILALRRRLGYVIQDGGLFPHLTARDNVTLMARHLQWPGERIKSRLEELASLTRFPRDGFSRFPAQLSGGQSQRVSLMRALMLDPEVLLLDEPLGALDPMIRHELQDDLREIFRQLNKTVVMVTHDIGEAGFFGDTIFLMKEGLIHQRGSLEDLFLRPADDFVTRFINAQRSPLDAIGGRGE